MRSPSPGLDSNSRRHSARAALTAALVVGATLSFATAVRAQAITTTVLGLSDRTSVDLTDLATQNGTPIGLDECQNENIQLRFTNVDSTRSNLEFFVGASCDDATIRQDNTLDSCLPLEFTQAIDMNSMVDVDIPVSSLLDCSQNSGIETIWVLALNQAADAVSGAGQMVTFPLAFDFDPPDAVADVDTTPGQDAFRVSWTGSTENLRGYEVYYVPGGCDESGMVITDQLGDPPGNGAQLTTTQQTASGAQIDFGASLEELPLNSFSAVAVRAVDAAGNIGPLSAGVCVERVPINSWFRAYCGSDSASADACGSSGCSVGRAGRSSPGGALFALLIAGALLLRRRRR